MSEEVRASCGTYYVSWITKSPFYTGKWKEERLGSKRSWLGREKEENDMLAFDAGRWRVQAWLSGRRPMLVHFLFRKRSFDVQATFV